MALLTCPHCGGKITLVARERRVGGNSRQPFNPTLSWVLPVLREHLRANPDLTRITMAQVLDVASVAPNQRRPGVMRQVAGALRHLGFMARQTATGREWIRGAGNVIV